MKNQATQRDYIDLHTVYPAEKIESETYIIKKFSLSVSEVQMELIRNRRDYWLVRGLKPNFEYVKLIKKGDGIMMSDTPMERNTNEAFLKKANGDVIIFGLGLGLIVLPLLSDPTIKSITVVELYQDLIDKITPILKQYDKQNKLTVVQGDAFTYKPLKTAKFDTVYFDIWIAISDDNYEEQKKLERGIRKHLNRENPNAFMDSWLKSYYQKERRKEKRNENAYGW